MHFSQSWNLLYVISVSEHFAFAKLTNTTGDNERPLTIMYAFHTIAHVYLHANCNDVH